MRAMRAVRAMWAAATAVAGVAGCVPASRYREPRAALAGTNPPSVEATAAALAGEWMGQYDGPLYARRGALSLSLRPVAGRPAALRPVAGRSVARTVAGTATVRLGATPSRVAVDSAQVGRGRVVLFLAPFADPESGATVRVRLDGALAADTLGGRLRADGAATAAAERRGGWRLVRVARRTAP